MSRTSSVTFNPPDNILVFTYPDVRYPSLNLLYIKFLTFTFFPGFYYPFPFSPGLPSSCWRIGENPLSVWNCPLDISRHCLHYDLELDSFQTNWGHQWNTKIFWIIDHGFQIQIPPDLGHHLSSAGGEASLRPEHRGAEAHHVEETRPAPALTLTLQGGIPPWVILSCLLRLLRPVKVIESSCSDSSSFTVQLSFAGSVNINICKISVINNPLPVTCVRSRGSGGEGGVSRRRLELFTLFDSFAELIRVVQQVF